MKRSNLLILFIGIAIIFFGCTKDDAVAPDRNQNDQEIKSLKFPGTSYTGTSNPVTGGINEPGVWTFLPNGNVKIKGMIVEWYDTADDPLLSGTSMWYENWLYNTEDPKIKIWGSADITVEGGDGVWHGSWHGFGTFQGNPPYGLGTSDIVAEIDLVLTGSGGEIQGMVAKAKYNINTVAGFYWTFQGAYH